MATHAEVAARALRNAILGTLLLGVGKAIAALLTHSTAVGASAVDALSDALVSGLNLLLVRAAAAPPDAGHPYGHGKAEGLAGLGQSIFLTLVVVGVGRSAVQHLLGVAPMPVVGPAVLVMMGSMTVSFLLARGLATAAEKTGSLVLRADATHYRMDIFTGAAVLVGLGASYFTGDGRADAIASLVLCAWMAREIAPIAWDAIGELMDRPLSRDEVTVVVGVIDQFKPRLLGYHDLRTRRAGPHRFVQVHIVMPPEMPLREAHRVADDLERALCQALPSCDPIVHLDPDGEDDRQEPAIPA